MGKDLKTKTLLSRLDNFARNNNSLFLGISIVLFLLFSLLTFDIKQSPLYDDAQYMADAIKMAKHFPDYVAIKHSPLYIIFLTVMTLIFGANIYIMKFSSILLVAGSIYFLNKLLKAIGISPLLAVMTLFTYAFNFYIIYYSHYTLTEPLFLLLQFAFLYYYIKLFPKDDETKIKFITGAFLSGILLCLMTLTRSVSYAVIPILVIFHFFYKKRWNYFGNMLLGFVSFFAFFSIIKRLLWGNLLSNSDQLYQLKLLMIKDPYNASKGVETFTGYMERFFGNFQFYISKRLYDIFGFIPNATKTHVLLSLFTAVILILVLRYILKNKKKEILLIWLYTVGLSGFTFLILQTRWDQLRLILIFAPFLFLLLYLFFEQYAVRKSYVVQLIFFILICIPPFINLKRDFNNVSEQLPVVRQNLNGNSLAGYSPDWINYIEASKWAAENLPENSVIMCRKSAYSYLYGKGKVEFQGVYIVPSENPDSLIHYLKDKNIEYAIAASLRRNPNMKTKYIINTVRRIFYYIQKEYPNIVTKVHTTGNDEQSIVFKINYPEKKNTEQGLNEK